ncbi:hypothetical protein B2D07_16785 [Desulfococcus multivorans]|uniref:Type I phosphodiesterase/nucleotide pyrophosphatase n=2 Tax=Desulfococcus multivorans TaxID=897 RepID=S7UJV4_DESML|nr:uncharacterized protein Dmul_33520 [Desulfococcus multivorans]AQV02257.2 hypothetical protein B2D07_16785 [Desulfococcus multivorans]EPR34089.1 type I phosphodiesterase/nucleotide pyrophosphatase [Desulfococcus multivorans DSM 2059]SKA27422.1 Predicted phosphohydrolase or phosphomutase, AlkP superfamily [Desulfococcus multivorans DSM 2059]
MPNLHKILAQNICLDVQEDLWSRGWAEILCGVHGRESGAFYAKPKLDGSHNTTQKFSVYDYDLNPDIKPLWARLCEKGHSVGFMNVPSMMPAPTVNGFAVAGGGAGAATSGASVIPLEGCYPNEARDLLIKKGYIVDTRFVSCGLRDESAFLNRLVHMTKIRTNAFICLQDRFHVRFGFVAFMAICRVQYLAMSEIEALIQNKGLPANSFQEKLLVFYEQIDEYIGKIMGCVSPEHVMFVSDHGQSPRLYSVNVNEWLTKSGFQHPKAKSSGTFKQAIKAATGIFPQSFKKHLVRTAPGLSAKLAGMNADWNRTKAFGVRYVPGIYINDQSRFAGPVSNDTESVHLAQEIVEQFNGNEEAKKNNLKARIYRNQYNQSRYEALLPDIWIDHPDAYFFEQNGAFIEPNKDYGPIKNLARVERDMFTGIKGRHPLFCVDPALAGLIRKSDEPSLTLAYKLILRGMEL